MKLTKKLFTILFFCIVITGCHSNETIDSKKEVKFYCNGVLDAIDYFFEDEKYIYSYGSQGNYIMYGNEKYTFKEALQKNIITIKDIDEEIKTQSSCQYDKTEK